MQEKKGAQALNKAFNKEPTHFCRFSGRNNYLKKSFSGGVAYCYLDAYHSNHIVELSFITLVVSRQNQFKVYKNPVTCEPPLKEMFSSLKSIQVTFRPNPNHDQQNLVQITYILHKGTRKSKLFYFSFSENVIKEKQEIELIQCSTVKPPIKTFWHPFFSQYFLVLNEDYFQWMAYRDESIEKCSSQKISKFGFGEQIVDFAFWPQEEGIRRFFIVAVGQSGTLFFLVCRLTPTISEYNLLSQKEKQLINSLQIFDLHFYDKIQCSFKNCEGIDIACPINSDFIFLFRRVSQIGSNGRTFSIQISSLMQQQLTITQKRLLGIKGQPQKHQFLIPHNCMMQGHFYFWCQDKLNVINLNMYIKYLNNIKNQNIIGKFPSKQFQAKLLMIVPIIHSKFVIIEKGGIKILRRHQTHHLYKFACLPVEHINIKNDFKKASEKLALIFKDLSVNLEQLAAQSNPEAEQNLPKMMYLPEEGDDKQLEDVRNNVESYVKNSSDILDKENKQINDLFNDTTEYLQEFERQKRKWGQLEEILNRIQRNEKTIQQLQTQLKQDDEYGDKLSVLNDTLEFIEKRPLQIQQNLRQKNITFFRNELSSVMQISKTIEQLQERMNEGLQN